MARTLYGDSYQGIAGLELGTDAARDQRFFNSLSANQRAQQIADAEDQSAAGQQLQWAQFLAGLAAQRRAQQEQAELQSQGLDQPHLQLAQLLQQAKLAREGNQLTRETNAARLGQAQGSELMGFVGQGAVRPDQISELYPDIPEATRQRAAAIFGNLAAQEEQQSTGNRNAAKTANELLESERMKQAVLLAKATPGSGFLRRTVPYVLPYGPLANQFLPPVTDPVSQEEAKAKIIADTRAGRQPLPPLTPEQFSTFLNNLFRNRPLQGKVQVDESAQTFSPAELPRRFLAPSPIAASVAQPRPGVSKVYATEAEARADGLRSGDTALFIHPGTGKVRRAQIE